MKYGLSYLIAALFGLSSLPRFVSFFVVFLRSSFKNNSRKINFILPSAVNIRRESGEAEKRRACQQTEGKWKLRTWKSADWRKNMLLLFFFFAFDTIWKEDWKMRRWNTEPRLSYTSIFLASQESENSLSTTTSHLQGPNYHSSVGCLPLHQTKMKWARL